MPNQGRGKVNQAKAKSPKGNDEIVTLPDNQMPRRKHHRSRSGEVDTETVVEGDKSPIPTASKLKKLPRGNVKSKVVRTVLLKSNNRSDNSSELMNNNAQPAEEGDSCLQPDRSSRSKDNDSKVMSNLDYEDDDFIPSDYQVAVGVDASEEAEFATDEEQKYEHNNGENDTDNHSDKESVVSAANSFAESRADTEVQFNSKPSKDGGIEKYIQSEIDRRWKIKELEMEKRFKRDGKVHNSSSPQIQPNNERVKSPSDTTIYAPSLMRIRSPGQRQTDVVDNDRPPMLNKISDFVESMRIESTTSRDTDGKSEGRNNDRQMAHSSSCRSDKEDARDAAAKLILEAEKFKASLTPPKGKDNNLFLSDNAERAAYPRVSGSSGELMEDDDFFHITCHVDPTLRAKIENGEYVELERLLVKDRFRKRGGEDRLEFFHKDWHTYLAPPEREYKIINVHKWEQAFRAYAAIYSKANPHRAAEIWQYIYIINTAAAYYVWDNVAFYDFTFRQMMGVNPLKSWAKTYNQMWNLAMHEPLQRGQQNNFAGGYSAKFNKEGNSSGYKKNNKGSRCWKFNKNQTCNAATCNFEHKCSYCGGKSHAVIDCNKLKFKNDREGGQKKTCKWI